MSKVNFSRNIFIEKEELNRFQNFLQDDSKSFLFKNEIISYGIVEQPSLLGVDFLVQNGSDSGTFKVANDSNAVDSDLLLLALSAFDNYPVTGNSLWYWVKISHRYTGAEQGTVSVNTSGQVSGSGTLFTEVLRSQTTKAPIKIKFYKEDAQGVSQIVVNDGIYEVVDIVSDTNVVLSGTFVNESDLKYVVVGSFSLGASITTEQKEGIYSYDNCRVSLVLESTLDTPPTAGYTADKDFYIARLRNVGGTLTIQDKRTDYFQTTTTILQDDLVEKINYATAEICRSLSRNANIVVLEGVVGSISGGSMNITAGAIYWGGEIYEVDAQSVADIGTTGLYYFSLDMTSLSLPVRKLILDVDTSIPSGGVLYAYYSYSVITYAIPNLTSFMLRSANNGSDIPNTTLFRTNINVWSKTQAVERHLTGTGATRPNLIGWTMDLSKVSPTAPSLIYEINLWKYQLPENCHILRIRPNQQSWFGTGSVLGTPIVPANGDRATLYKILPPAGIYDGYELIVQVDCHDTSPTSEKSRYFSILGQYTVVADAVNYLGNIVISTQKEEVLKVTILNELTYANKIATGAPPSNSMIGQMVNISSGDIKTAQSVVTDYYYAQYCRDMLYIKLKWNSARSLWEQIGLSQPYVS